ncbi:type IV secretory system conjugative DNA transfer family protein [Helicobacter cinaedi]|uniref:type IV secretory system conjugative DNA transfer family protein n=1 Tax=Helicobacter cinaedi TaxID=213 RepID=UPI001E310DF7|nr:type IV secretory system conjugative DNA transfer family protein [Helicobacter cinaedi]
MLKEETKKNIKRDALSLIMCVILSVIIFFCSIFYFFHIPTSIENFKIAYNIGIEIFSNLGNPNLKLKSYMAIIYALIPLVIWIVFSLIGNSMTKGEYGNARLADKKELAQMGLNYEEGMMFGCFRNGNKKPPTFIRSNKPLATLIVAPPGTGKTASIAIPNLLSLPQSCVVLDIKGELYQKTAGYRQQKLDNKVLLFSPFSDENTMFFNPFDNKVIKDMNFVQMKKLADQIAGTIFVGEKGKENDHWVVSAKTMFSFFALYNMEKFKHTTLADLAQAPKKDYYNELQGEFLEMCQIQNEETGEIERNTKEDTLKAFFLQVSNDESLNDIVRNQARQYSTAAQNEFASIKSTYDTFMAVFGNPQVAKAVSKMSFNYEDLREEHITMYIVIQTEDMDILAPLIRILLESMCKKLMTNENSDPNKFIYLILDEFVRFGKMPFLLEMPALCRSFGLVPLYITQSYEQIKKYYGEDDLRIIRANVAYQVVFRMNSFEDAETLSKMIGDFTREKVSTSKGNLDLLKHNVSTNAEGYKLITAQDILSNPIDKIYILVGGFLNRPIKADVNFWFKVKEWEGADKIAYIPPNDKAQTPTEQNSQEEQMTKEETESNQNNYTYGFRSFKGY